MKSFLLLLSIIGISYAAPSAQLVQDLRDFFVAVPLDKIRKISNEHLENDPDYQAALKYMQGREFKTMVKDVHAKPSVKEAIMIVRDAGVDIELFEKVMEAYIEALNINVADNQQRSFAKFLKDIDDIMPYEKLMDMMEYKLEHSVAFREMYDTISSERMNTLADKILRSEEVRVLIKELVAMDIPVYKYVEAAYAILGWNNYAYTPNDLD